MSWALAPGAGSVCGCVHTDSCTISSPVVPAHTSRFLQLGWPWLRRLGFCDADAVGAVGGAASLQAALTRLRGCSSRARAHTLVFGRGCLRAGVPKIRRCGPKMCFGVCPGIHPTILACHVGGFCGLLMSCCSAGCVLLTSGLSWSSKHKYWECEHGRLIEVGVSSLSRLLNPNPYLPSSQSVCPLT